MKKSMLTLTAIALSAAASPAMAGTLTAEVRLADVRNNKVDSTELKVEYWDAALKGAVKLGAELQAKDTTNAAVKSTASVKAGVEGPAALGFTTLAYGEVGQVIKVGNNADFWGLGIKGSRQLIGNVSLHGGYRHREGFTGADGMNEERVHAGLGVALTDNTAVGATYYRTRGTTDSDAVGISLTRKF